MSYQGIYRGRALRNVQAGEVAEFIVGTPVDADRLAEQLRSDIRMFGRAYSVRGLDGLEVRLDPSTLVVHLAGKDVPYE